LTFPANNNHDLSLQTAILMIPNADNDTPPKHNRLVPFLEEMSVFTLMSGSKFDDKNQKHQWGGYSHNNPIHAFNPSEIEKSFLFKAYKAKKGDWMGAETKSNSKTKGTGTTASMLISCPSYCPSDGHHQCWVILAQPFSVPCFVECYS